MSTDDLDRVWAEISKMGSCMMVSLVDGAITMRPAVGQVDRAERAIWIPSEFIEDDSAIHEDGFEIVCLAYLDTTRSVFVAISGVATGGHPPSRSGGPVAERAARGGGKSASEETFIKVEARSVRFWMRSDEDLFDAMALLTGRAGHDHLLGPGGFVEVEY